MSIIDSFLNNLIEILDSKAEPKKNLDTRVNVPKNPIKDPADKLTPNLYIGKILEDSMIKCEVVNVHKTNIHVKILDIYWPRMETYLDLGKTYPVFKHSGWEGRGLEVWEISPKRMKRSTSQVILQWEEGLGWCWDLDS